MNALPLSLVESFSYQKCLLPKSHFPSNAKPGTWANITLSSNTIILCQLYPRDDQQQQHARYFYLDTCVVSNPLETIHDIPNAANPTVEGQQLVKIDCLQTSANAREIELTLFVTDKIFSLKKNMNHLSLSLLSEVAHTLLQSVNVLAYCTVYMKELCSIGIAAIKVHVINSKPNTVYAIDEYTPIVMKDVRLIDTTQTNVSSDQFFTMGFEEPHQALRELLELPKMKRRKFSLNAVVVSGIGCGKSALVAQVLKEKHCNCFHVVPSKILGQYPGETESQLRSIFRKAQAFQRQLKPQVPTVILLEHLDLLCPTATTGNGSSGDALNGQRMCAQLTALLDELNNNQCGIICIATTTSAEDIHDVARRPGRFNREIPIAALAAENRRCLFASFWHDSYLAETVFLTPQLLDVVEKQTHGFVVSDLKLLVTTMQQMLPSSSGNATTEDILKEALNAALKKLQPTAMRSADVQVVRLTQGFKSIGGMEHLKRMLEKTILAALQKRERFEHFGIGPPKGVLLYGPPGCAKTTIAKCLAAEANYNFISVSGAEVYSPYVGCAEKFIAKIFDTARKNAPCVIFLDEIDTLVGRRQTGASDVQIRILSTLLTEMDGIIKTQAVAYSDHIIIVAATNRPDMVDDALLRPGRFDKLVHVAAPDYKSRLSILQLFAQQMPFAADVNLCDIAERTVNYSGADLCCICNEAALHALQCNIDAVEITFANFEHVLLHQKSSLTQEQLDWFENYEKRVAHV